MSKKIWKLLLPVLIVVLVCGAIWGGLVIYRNVSKQPVKVYRAVDFAMTDYWGDTSSTYGMVTTSQLQNVTVSETQTVTEIYVQEGQEVKEGDPLIAFDTTLSDIDLQKADIALQKLKLNYENAKKELEALQKARPHSTVLIVPEGTGVVYEPHETPALLAGTGREEDPYVYLWDKNGVITPAFIKSVADLGVTGSAAPETGEESDPAEEPAEPSQPKDKNVYCALVVRKKNALNGPIQESWGLKIREDGSGFVFCDPVLSEEIMACDVEPEPYYKDYGSPYTAAELTKLRADKENEIKDIEIQIKMAEVDLAKLQQEVNNGIVYSKQDGTVKFVRDPDECRLTGEAVLSVSGGTGGYYIEVAMTELELESMQIGQSVIVNSWWNGMQYEGTVVAISDYPTTSENNWTNGNSNVSYYPFTVFVDASAELQEYNYVDIQYTAADAQQGGTWYLQSMLVRSEGGKSYVYVMGADGRLERRTVQTGKNLWGNYIEIRGGITTEDRIAFPYGKDVVDGAKTVEASAEEIYGY